MRVLLKYIRTYVVYINFVVKIVIKLKFTTVL